MRFSLKDSTKRTRGGILTSNQSSSVSDADSLLPIVGLFELATVLLEQCLGKLRQVLSKLDSIFLRVGEASDGLVFDQVLAVAELDFCKCDWSVTDSTELHKSIAIAVHRKVAVR